MGRRNKPQNPVPRTLRHFQDRAPDNCEAIPRSENGVPVGRGGLDRLAWSPLGPGGSESFLADQISRPANSHVRWYCDTNMFLTEMDDRFWDALLSRNGRLVLIPPICEELQVWLNNPSYNKQVRDPIQRRIDGDDSSSVGLYDPCKYPERVLAIEYYVNLLGFRKRLHACAEAELLEKLERSPSSQEISNYCKDRFGIRGQLLASKGKKNTVEDHFCNDEALVVMAALESIYTGVESVILTRDEDVFEQFFKGLWLINTHYRGMLLAECYRRDPLYFSPSRVESKSLSEVFDGDVLLLTKPSGDLTEILPTRSTLVPISCILIKGGKIHQLTFGAETEMSDLFGIKARTGGSNTTLFGDRNCHVCLAHWMNAVGNVAAIGRDRSPSPEEWKFSLSALDLNLVAHSNEGFVERPVVNPDLLWLPPGARDWR